MWLLLLSAQAQQYSIPWATISGGGGTSTGGVYRLTGTIGQPIASAPSTGGSYSLTAGFWAGAIQTPGAPFLFLNRQGNAVVLSWSAASTGFTLESKQNLSSATWSPVSPAPATFNGMNYATNTIDPRSRFYRLHIP